MSAPSICPSLLPVIVLLASVALPALSAVEGEAPSVHITAPVDDALAPSGFTVLFEVRAWTLEPGGRHAHWSLDGVDQGPVYEVEPLTITGLSPGEHSIGIDLRESDHSPIGVADSVTITVEAAAAQGLALQTVASGLQRPVGMAVTPGDPDLVHVIEQHSGRIMPLDVATDTLGTEPLLTVTDISGGGEQGLLGIAFHPEYASNGLLYVSVTNASGHSELRCYHIDGETVTGPQIELAFDQPQGNHNGGWLAFGPDGHLYLATGDGGGKDDSGSGHVADIGNAQSLDTLLGKILRIDVDGDDFPADPDRNYAIPADNPFVATPDARPEIWAYGLRHPWRAAFDGETGALWIGDVGQGAREEIDVLPAETPAGANFGWRLREGSIATPSGRVGGPAPDGAIDPIFDYPRTTGRTVIGGAVYRGPVPAFRGRYFFADYPTDAVWSFRADGDRPDVVVEHAAVDGLAVDKPSSFGEDAAGRLYLLELDGTVSRLVPRTHRRVTIAVSPAPASAILASDAADTFPLDGGGAVSFAWRHPGLATRIGFADDGMGKLEAVAVAYRP